MDRTETIFARFAEAAQFAGAEAVLMLDADLKILRSKGDAQGFLHGGNFIEALSPDRRMALAAALLSAPQGRRVGPLLLDGGWSAQGFRLDEDHLLLALTPERHDQYWLITIDAGSESDQLAQIGEKLALVHHGEVLAVAGPVVRLLLRHEPDLPHLTEFARLIAVLTGALTTDQAENLTLKAEPLGQLGHDLLTALQLGVEATDAATTLRAWSEAIAALRAEGPSPAPLVLVAREPLGNQPVYRRAVLTPPADDNTLAIAHWLASMDRLTAQADPLPLVLELPATMADSQLLRRSLCHSPLPRKPIILTQHPASVEALAEAGFPLGLSIDSDHPMAIAEGLMALHADPRALVEVTTRTLLAAPPALLLALAEYGRDTKTMVALAKAHDPAAREEAQALGFSAIWG